MDEDDDSVILMTSFEMLRFYTNKEGQNASSFFLENCIDSSHCIDRCIDNDDCILFKRKKSVSQISKTSLSFHKQKIKQYYFNLLRLRAVQYPKARLHFVVPENLDRFPSVIGTTFILEAKSKTFVAISMSPLLHQPRTRVFKVTTLGLASLVALIVSTRCMASSMAFC